MEKILRAIAAEQPDGIDLLIALVDAIRPPRADMTDLAINNLRSLAFLLDTEPRCREALRAYLMHIFNSHRQVHLYTDTGILSKDGFFTELSRKIGDRILPPAINQEYMRDAFGQVFHQKDDYIWIEQVPNRIWLSVVRALKFAEERTGTQASTTTLELLNALQVLSYRITEIGLQPDLVRHHPDIERFESPFITQNHEIRDYLARFPERLAMPDLVSDDKHLRILLDQCMLVIDKIRKQAGHNGVSINFTYSLQRLHQHIERLKTLLDLVEPTRRFRRPYAALDLFRLLVRAQNRRNSVRDLISTNVQLVARQITEHAGRTGEHYVTTDRRGYLEMFRSASGAGFIVGFMAVIKIMASKLHAAPLIEAFLYSMNYSFGFMLIHTLHYTVATKQPAMTAAKIAASIPQSGRGSRNLSDLTDLVVNVLRTQFVAILGNVVIAFPTSFAIAWLTHFATGQHIVGTEKAWHLLQDIDPFQTLAVFHAAIAGACLFLAGLISGYYDNLAIFNQVPQRLRQLKWLQSLLGPRRLGRFASYIENNMGALAGNFYFGIMLGCMGTLGFILGLPIDIRHITFSTANFAYAVVALDYQIPWQTTVITIAGIALIGFVNLAVSFSLALFVALRSRGENFSSSRQLTRSLIRRFFSRPTSFFFPPKSRPAEEEGAH